MEIIDKDNGYILYKDIIYKLSDPTEWEYTKFQQAHKVRMCKYKPIYSDYTHKIKLYCYPYDNVQFYLNKVTNSKQETFLWLVQHGS